MDERIDFNLNESLKYFLSDPATVPTPEAHGDLVECENDPDSLTNSLINGVLNPIVDSIAGNPDGLTRSEYFDSLQLLLKCAPISLMSQRDFEREPDCELFKQSRYTQVLPTHALSKILDLIVSGLAAEADIVQQDCETDEQDAIQHHKQLLEMYGFLLQWTLSAVEVKAAEKPTAAAAPIRRGKTSKKASAKDANWDSSAQIQVAMDVMCKVLKLKLTKIFLTTSDRDTFVNLFTRTVYLILESEQRVKNTAIRMHVFKVLCIAVKHQGHAFGK